MKARCCCGCWCCRSMPALVAALQRGGERLTSAALGVQGLLAAAFLLFILFTSNPFLRLDPAPFEGAGLNPLLQDPGLAMHPPMLYAGYVGLSASFSYAAAALMVGEEGWARAARPFMLIAWIALTCGIALGSWWAYYELGWGGFWFWDPVENASLMPWLIATALLHSALATEKSGAFRTWTLLLAIAGFSMSPDRHLPGALRRAVVGACLCQRSHPRLLHHGADRAGHRRGAGAVRLARAHAAGRRGLRHRSAARPRCCSTMSSWWRPAPAVFVGTLYPLVLDAHDRHQDFRRSALLCADLRADLFRAAAAGAVRAAAGLAARRSESGLALALSRAGPGRRSRRWRCWPSPVAAQLWPAPAPLPWPAG